MTNKDKQLLLKDLSARLSYGVICHYNCAIRCDTMEIKKANCVGKLEGIIPFNGHIGFMVGGDKVNALFHDIKPYLRSLSSMTDEEKLEVKEYINSIEGKLIGFKARTIWVIDYLNSIHVDYRGLIKKGLAIEVTEENNPYEEINS